MSQRLVLRVALLSLPVAAGLVFVLYMTNVIGCTPPKTQISQREGGADVL
jgi:hypothetical protein